MPFCTECGTKCDDGFRFCNNCGHPLTGSCAPAEEPAEVGNPDTVSHGSVGAVAGCCAMRLQQHCVDIQLLKR